jgi:hypothetical protein
VIVTPFPENAEDDRATAIRDTWRGTTEHRAVVRARSLEESMEQALLALHLTHKDAQKIEAVETNNRDILVRYQEGSILAATNRSPSGQAVDRTKRDTPEREI